ncbi:hypothetical protein Ae406Ps2_6308c [Pseudonocardia sp. Ae406_Ps2]|uniref:hypothetical protein n=1 Tax=unclassified Pseudonocardia TaxID=2619320 RepID=UPI00094B4A91|nr:MULTISPECIES: hypothetical protein [unclassified Pseudonocardia]OLL88980.1 hypothetical protein Ae331Ps2_6379 [Pseudonocardia sp. Ae331_Ps2]OLL90006.1 hypothetical protein Ae406Ps2_6308c [Pseudonocardia sp. Ae406_Ps2]OLM09420.1 hypothetical protein Ae706Ps2_6442c [Pseudonocardia sp. Ae706_Ps2]OLM09423.1 hypothetical protein Ae706Ps2_6445c [Pseudonocardia sp. Ae706_Ps2]
MTAHPSLVAALEQLTALVTALDARISHLETVVISADDGESGPGTADGLRPVAWPQLDAADAAAAWDELGTWVGQVLTPTLEPSVRQIPPCWPAHSWGRETLSWLHAAYRQAYSPHGSGFQAAEWHTRWVPHAYAAFAAPEAAQGGFCDRPEHRAAGGDPGRRLEDSEWRPWFDRARAADLEHRRAAGTAQAATVPRAGAGASSGG